MYTCIYIYICIYPLTPIPLREVLYTQRACSSVLMCVFIRRACLFACVRSPKLPAISSQRKTPPKARRSLTYLYSTQNVVASASWIYNIAHKRIGVRGNIENI